jgi:hypothetical protein
MPLSIVVFDNPAPDEAIPILSTCDPAIVGELRRLLNIRLTAADYGGIVPIRPRTKVARKDTREPQGEASV